MFPFFKRNHGPSGGIEQDEQEAIMQLIDTRISTNDDHTTVVFAGEGNEEVSVRMAANGLQEKDAVLRAKTIMVHLTRFEERSGEATVDGAAEDDEGDVPNPAASPSTGRLFQNGDTDRDG